MQRFINKLIYFFGITNVDRAVKGLSKAMDNLDKVVDRQQQHADELEHAAKLAIANAAGAKEEAERAKRIRTKMNDLMN